MKYLTPKEVAELEGFPFSAPNTVKKLIKRGEFGKKIEIGKNPRWIVEEEEVKEWIKTLKK